MMVAGRDVALTAPGASRADTYKMVINGESKTAPLVARNFAALLDLFEWKFGDRSVSPSSTSRNPASVNMSVDGYRRAASRVVFFCGFPVAPV